MVSEVKEIDVWYMHYYNVHTKVAGIVVHDSLKKTEKYRDDLEKNNITGMCYDCLEITGPHKHKVK